MVMEVACGQCVGCRLDRSRDWAIRIVHEAQLYSDNCFLTLTYAPDFLPDDGSLVKKDFQDFVKRLRKHFSGQRIRYFHCGEYGEQLHRPHYHAVFFNLDFEDKVLLSEGAHKLYRSALLDSIWSKGFCSIGDVTFESASYCARYILKKLTGDRARAHYEVVIEATGEVVQLVSEYTTMSRRPGIGREWYEKFKDDVFPSDQCVIQGRIFKPPRYYEEIFRIEDPEGYEFVKRKRDEFFLEHAEDCTPQRLRDREVVKKAQVNLKRRSLEEI